ncbi:MAG: methyltransferase domain-containing protein [Cyanobacteriota/Melainabacteria group bacterium]
MTEAAENSNESKDSNKRVIAELFWLSVVGLFFELLVIRWMGTEVRACSIYKNFPLIACYVGLGFGFMKDSGKEKWFKLFPVFLLLLVIALATSDWTGLAYIMAPSASTAISSTWWDGYHPPENAISDTNTYIIVSLISFFLLIITVALTFAGIGERLGRLFNELKPLEAYAINLVGSAIGIFLFSILSFLGMPPFIWILVGSLPAVWVLRRHKISIGILLACIVVPLVVPARGMTYTDAARTECKTMWSPYHRVDMGPLFYTIGEGENAKKIQVGQTISVNKGYFQQPLNLSKEFISDAGNPQRITDFVFDQYEFPYHFIKPKKVLILGAGTGNDVAAALRNGAEQVDAVEIDPLMAELGKKIHPEKPYDSPKVRVFVDDARAYLRKTNEKYDLVLTGFLDSHTVAGNSLSVRLDDYVYTVDGMQSAMEHLNPGGLYSICYCATEDFLKRRLIANLRVACDRAKIDKPLGLLKKETMVFHFLSPVTDSMKEKVPGLEAMGYENISDADSEGIKPSTDDWPYLYLKPTDGIDPVYLIVNIIVLALAWMWCGKNIRSNNSPGRWQLFFLGSAFLLLELSIIDRMALIFGTVWIVNSVCIFAVLLAIILANMLVLKKPGVFKPDILYTLLFLSIMAIYFMPLEIASSLGMFVGGSIAAAISVIPIFVAGLIFSGSFASEKQPAVGLAFNMFGAVIGGLLEYSATYTGIRGLLLIAFALYAISFVCLKVKQKMQEQGPEPEPEPIKE